MATYATGTSTGPADLIGTKLAAFAAANGWSVSSVSGGFFQFINGSIRANLAWDSVTVVGQMSAGYASGSAWNAQPDNSGIVAQGNVQAGPFTSYHFYAGSEAGHQYLHCIVEWSAGNYWHLFIGELVKFGAYTGGQYLDMLWVHPNYKQLPYTQGLHRAPFDSFGQGADPTNSGQIRADIDAKTNNWLITASANSWTGNSFTGGMRGGLYGNLVHPIGYQKYNSLTPMHPVDIFGDRGANLRSPIGRVPDTRQVSMRNLTPGQLMTVGSDQWQCFPLWTRSDSSGAYLTTPAGQPQYSHYLGIAYKR